MDSRVLLVHRDRGFLRALEADLLSEGFEVHTTSNGSEGWKIFQGTRPGLVVTDVEIGEPDGFAFASRLRHDPFGKTVSVILVDGNRASGRRLQAIEAGADSRLVGPDAARGVLTRTRLLFGSPKREAAGGVRTAPRGFACDLADLDVVDLVALVQRNGRSGVGTLTAPDRVPGSLFFDQGRLIDAQSGHTSGMEAFHRLACWTGGALNLEWRNFRRRDILGRPPSDLVTSGLANVEEWTKLLGRLGTPTTVFRVDLDALIDRLSSTFGQLTEVLNACDGVRSVVQIVDECSVGALDVLRSLLQLRDEGLISDPGQPARPDRIQADLDSTLMGGGAPHDFPLAPRSPGPRPSVPHRDPPLVGGSRPTAPLGQAGLPVSVAEAMKLPPVTMQFPSGIPIPGRDLDPSAAPQPVQLGQPNSVQAESESSRTRLTGSRPLPPRIRPPSGPVSVAPAASPSQDAQPPEPTRVEDTPKADDTAEQPSQAPIARAAPSPHALTIAGHQPIVRGASTEQAPGETPLPAQQRPWWDRRSERRPPGPARDGSSDAKGGPVWPQSAVPAQEPTTTPTRAEREPPVAPVESPTVYLPARSADGQPTPPRPEPERLRPARPAPARAAAARRPVPHAEGIRQRPGDRSGRARGTRKNLPWWERHRPLLLAIGTSVLLGALVAIGVALVRSIPR